MLKLTKYNEYDNFGISAPVYYYSRNHTKSYGITRIPGSKSMAKKAISSKRKQEILKYVLKVNLEKAQGGVAAAAKQFKVHQNTIMCWMKNPQVIKKDTPAACRG